MTEIDCNVDRCRELNRDSGPRVKGRQFTVKSMARYCARARALGAAAGKNAAAWIEQDTIGGRTTGSPVATCEAILDDDNYEFWDGINYPSLSGEWADGETPATLAKSIGLDLNRPSADVVLDECCCAWQDASGEALQKELRRMAKATLRNWTRRGGR